MTDAAPKNLRPVFRCNVCASHRLQVEAWMWINTEKLDEPSGSGQECWCESCQAHTTFDQHRPGVHDLKTWPVPFERLEVGEKPWEIRRDDRVFNFGDYLRLREWDPATAKYTGRELWRRVTLVLHGAPMPDGFVGMTVEVV